MEYHGTITCLLLFVFSFFGSLDGFLMGAFASPLSLPFNSSSHSSSEKCMLQNLIQSHVLFYPIVSVDSTCRFLNGYKWNWVRHSEEKMMQNIEQSSTTSHGSFEWAFSSMPLTAIRNPGVELLAKNRTDTLLLMFSKLSCVLRWQRWFWKRELKGQSDCSHLMSEWVMDKKVLATADQANHSDIQ